MNLDNISRLVILIFIAVLCFIALILFLTFSGFTTQQSITIITVMYIIHKAG